MFYLIRSTVDRKIAPNGWRNKCFCMPMKMHDATYVSESTRDRNLFIFISMLWLFVGSLMQQQLFKAELVALCDGVQVMRTVF